MHKITLFILFVFCSCGSHSPNRQGPSIADKPKVSFTFDDGVTNDILDYPFESWNGMILNSLEQAGVTAVFFVTGANKLDEKGRYLLKSWNDKGHTIANHSYTHPDFSDEKYSAGDFETELMKTDSVISGYGNYARMFRFPYLKEGKTRGKIDGMRAVLKEHHYRNGYVTIDASDWYVDSRLRKKIKEKGPAGADLGKFRDFYVAHIIERAKFYEELSFKLNGRHIPHTLLLHHNLASALFLDDLIKKFKAEGWEITDARKAFADPVFNTVPAVVPAGESLIWSMAKASGRYEQVLRYPAEDSRYEEKKMNELGL